MAVRTLVVPVMLLMFPLSIHFAAAFTLLGVSQSSTGNESGSVRDYTHIPAAGMRACPNIFTYYSLSRLDYKSRYYTTLSMLRSNLQRAYE